MSQNFNIKKIIPSIFKSSQKGFDECNHSNEERDNLIFQDQPVRVQIAFTKTKPDGTEQVMTKESLTQMMRNNEEFDSFVRNQYKLNSTVIVEGYKDNNKKDPQIYVSDHIPVNVRRTIRGKKRNKEIHISGKLYKPESKRTGNLKRSQSVMDERVNLRNTTLRRVELPLTELRSSLSGFTRRITNFEVVPWLTATYISSKRSQVSSKSELHKKTTSQRKLDSPVYPVNSIHDKHMIAMPTNLEYNQFPSGNYKADKESLIFNPYANVKTKELGDLPKEIRPDLKEESKRNIENIRDKSVSGRKFYFENLQKETKSDILKIPQQSENLIEKFQTEDSKKTFNDRRSYFEIQAQKKPEISEQTLNRSKSSSVKDVNKKMGSISKSLNEKGLNLISGPNSLENSNISNFVTVSNLTCDQTHCHRNVEERKSSNNNQMLIPKNKNDEDQHEEIPVSSITITRSRTRIIKYDDGTGIEEKIGRQTFRVEAPNGSLYTCKTCLWPIISGENNNNNNNMENHNEENKITYQNYANNKSKIDQLNRDDEIDKDDDDDDNNNTNNYSIYATQNIYQLNYPKEKQEENEEKYDFTELIGDKYNPLTWLYNNYAKTKNLIKQFNHE